ncbi:hypothetical protein [Kribbella sp. NPDC051137]|uniref:hypothetical protein n=1 Tax=Kribbella sp. NPDC051137 TaxID=3155045 RepID=UPI003445FBD9
MTTLPQGYQLPPVQAPAPSAAMIAWMATIPAQAVLTNDERARITKIQQGSTDARVTNRATQLLNGTVFS